jgi:hypothetical protein
VKHNALLAKLRANGAEVVERDGRTFQVLRLPGATRDFETATPVRPRHARGTVAVLA